MTAVALQATGLTKRYGRKTALADCTLEVPAGRVVGLVGPNGAGKSTLLNLAAGLLAPTAGAIEVLGAPPAGTPEQRARVGFVAQDTPTYGGFSVEDHLQLGARLNPGWDDELAQRRIARLGLDPAQKARKLSGGQRAQLALTLGLAKRPELLLLDEPVAALDPLNRREFLQGPDGGGRRARAERRAVLAPGLRPRARVRLPDRAGRLARAAGRRPGHACSPPTIASSARAPTAPEYVEVITASHTERQSTLIVRTRQPIIDPSWTVARPTLEDIVLAYMERRVTDHAVRTELEVVR